MPVIKQFGGFAIVMYFEDHNPPHVHAVSADFEAQIAIQSGRFLRGDMPARFRRQALDWIAANKAMLMERWNAYH